MLAPFQTLNHTSAHIYSKSGLLELPATKEFCLIQKHLLMQFKDPSRYINPMSQRRVTSSSASYQHTYTCTYTSPPLLLPFTNNLPLLFLSSFLPLFPLLPCAHLRSDQIIVWRNPGDPRGPVRKVTERVRKMDEA